MSNEELIVKVKELEENQIELLESLPQIIKNFIHYDKIEVENNKHKASDLGFYH